VYACVCICGLENGQIIWPRQSSFSVFSIQLPVPDGQVAVPILHFVFRILYCLLAAGQRFVSFCFVLPGFVFRPSLFALWLPLLIVLAIIFAVCVCVCERVCVRAAARALLLCICLYGRERNLQSAFYPSKNQKRNKKTNLNEEKKTNLQKMVSGQTFGSRLWHFLAHIFFNYGTMYTLISVSRKSLA